MVVTNATQRDQFVSGYAKLVLDAFDAVAEFDKRLEAAATAQEPRS